jgi:hypothetical protein
MIRLPAVTLETLRLSTQGEAVTTTLAFQFGDRVEAYGADALMLRRYDADSTLNLDAFDDGRVDWKYESSVVNANDAASFLSKFATSRVVILNGDDLVAAIERETT